MSVHNDPIANSRSLVLFLLIKYY